jgi:hypothetical protein
MIPMFGIPDIWNVGNTITRNTEEGRMSNELVGTQQNYSLQEVREIAKDMADSGLFAVSNQQQAFALMMLCRSEGLDPIQAMKRYHIIEGRPSMRADAMQAEFQRQGGTVEWVESNEEVCEAIFSHASSPRPFQLRVTTKQYIDSGVAMGFDRQAQKQTLKKNWKQFPAAMLRARVISSGVRAVLPGVVAGIYTPEEVQDFEKESTSNPNVTVHTKPTQKAAKVPTAEVADYTPAPTQSRPTPASVETKAAPVAEVPAAELPLDATHVEQAASTEPAAEEFKPAIHQKEFVTLGVKLHTSNPAKMAELKPRWIDGTNEEKMAVLVELRGLVK